MLIQPTPLDGAALIDLKRLEDDRGFFARSFCRQEFIDAGLDPVVEQTNISFNHQAGTLRGMHFQFSPHQETKLVRCLRGAIWDVIVDLRPGSPTFMHHFGVDLTEDNMTSLLVPKDFGHGYIALTDGATVHYQVSTAYVPGAEGGLRWDDPDLALPWPIRPTVISPKDTAWPLLSEQPLSDRMGGSR